MKYLISSHGIGHSVWSKFLFLFFVCLLLSAGHALFAQSIFGPQDPPEPYTFTPPSPTAASLGQVGFAPKPSNSGAVSTSIPLHTFTAGSISVPIGLNYRSNGVKLDEVAPWTGMGWQLSAGGAITRIVRDEMDETSQSGYPDFIDFNDPLFIEYFKRAETEVGYDTEPDLYSFHFLGYSGAFTRNRYGDFIIMPYQKLKLEQTYDSAKGYLFHMTTPDGTKYTFGGNDATEKSQASQQTISTQPPPEVTTTWFLTKIEHINGDEVFFEYLSDPRFSSGSYYEYDVTTSYSITEYQSIGTFFSQCATSCQNATPVNGQEFYMSVHHRSRFPSRIYSPGQGSIEFVHQERTDVIGAPRLDTIHIKDLHGQVLRSFDFNYKYAQQPLASGDSHLYSRLFLTGLTEIDEAGNDFKSWELSYQNEDDLPPRFDDGIDHWGYYNGKSVQNNGRLPATDYLHPVNGNPLFSGNADRSADGTYGAYGMLKKVTYPTGGALDFTYEPRFYDVSTAANTFTTIPMASAIGTSDFSIVSTPIQIQNPLGGRTQLFLVTTPLDTGSIKLKGHGYLEIYEEGKNVPNVRYKLEPNSGKLYSVYFSKGKNYVLKIVADGWLETRLASFKYAVNTGTSTIVQQQMGGVRLKSQTKTDPVTGDTQYQRYYYGPVANKEGNSGQPYRLPTYRFDYKSEAEAFDPAVGPIFPPPTEWVYETRLQEITIHFDEQHQVHGYIEVVDWFEKDMYDFSDGIPTLSLVQSPKKCICTYASLTTNSLVDLYPSSSAMDYEYVTVSYGNDTFATGGEEMQFMINPDQGARNIGYAGVMGAPTSNTGYNHGNLLRQRVFKIEAGQVVTLSESENTYVLDANNRNSARGLVVRRVYTPLPNAATAINDVTCTERELHFSEAYWSCDANHDHLYLRKQLASPLPGTSPLPKTVDRRTYTLADANQDLGYMCTAPGHNNTLSFRDHPCRTNNVAKDETYTLGLYPEHLGAAEYENFSFWSYLSSTKATTYDQNGENPISVVTEYAFDNPKHAQLTYTQQVHDGGTVYESRNWYPADYQVGVGNVDVLLSNFQHALPIKSESAVDGYLYGGTVTEYNGLGQALQMHYYQEAQRLAWPTHDDATYLPSHYPTTPEATFTYNNNKPAIVLGRDGIVRSLLWGHNNTLVVAEATNALAIYGNNGEIFYDGFEDENTSTPQMGHAGLGYHSGGYYTFPATLKEENNAGLIMSYYFFENGEWQFSGLVPYGTIDLPNATRLDEIRVHPEDAQMVTYTHRPGVGVTSIQDVNGRMTYYEYDDAGRLKALRDHEGNIREGYQYQYAQPSQQ